MSSLLHEKKLFAFEANQNGVKYFRREYSILYAHSFKKFLNVQLLVCGDFDPFPHWGTSMYYVITKGGGRGSAKYLRLLTWGEGGLKGHAYVIIVWKKNAE